MSPDPGNYQRLDCLAARGRTGEMTMATLSDVLLGFAPESPATENEQRRAIRIEELRAMGFDARVDNRKALKVSCDGCRPIVAGNVAIHEHDCKNWIASRERGESLP